MCSSDLRMPTGAGQDFARSLPEPRPERGDEMAHVCVAGHGRHGSYCCVRIPQQGPGALQTFGACGLEDRPRMGYMPQKFGLYEDLSVMENLTLHADLRGVTGAARDETFARLLEFTDLRRFTTRMAGRLSGGMKQKLGLACALLGTPEVLLLDEPGVGVDLVFLLETIKRNLNHR